MRTDIASARFLEGPERSRSGLQQRVGDYRADFVVAYAFFGAEIDIVVECDGHDFHERTKQQAARDKKRDRFMTAQGYRLRRASPAPRYSSRPRNALRT